MFCDEHQGAAFTPVWLILGVNTATHLDIARAKLLPGLAQSRDGPVRQAAGDGEHGVEVAQRPAQLGHLQEKLDLAHALLHRRLADDLGDHPEHLVVGGAGETLKVALLLSPGKILATTAAAITVEIPDVVNVLGPADAAERQEAL